VLVRAAGRPLGTRRRKVSKYFRENDRQVKWILPVSGERINVARRRQAKQRTRGCVGHTTSIRFSANNDHDRETPRYVSRQNRQTQTLRRPKLPF